MGADLAYKNPPTQEVIAMRVVRYNLSSVELVRLLEFLNSDANKATNEELGCTNPLRVTYNDESGTSSTWTRQNCVWLLELNSNPLARKREPAGCEKFHVTLEISTDVHVYKGGLAFGLSDIRKVPQRIHDFIMSLGHTRNEYVRMPQKRKGGRRRKTVS